MQYKTKIQKCTCQIMTNLQPGVYNESQHSLPRICMDFCILQESKSSANQFRAGISWHPPPVQNTVSLMIWYHSIRTNSERIQGNKITNGFINEQINSVQDLNNANTKIVYCDSNGIDDTQQRTSITNQTCYFATICSAGFGHMQSTQLLSANRHKVVQTHGKKI